ncbi:MAG: hypothetical protein KC635_18585 [Myxococcales bacterium]|nr:hypothetical protein [Myxococcales bacterium]
MSPAKDPHHRAPADDPRLAPRRTTAADHATSEAALRPGKDGQSPALAPPNAAALAKVAGPRASLLKRVGESREIALQFMQYASVPPSRSLLAKVVEPLVHAVDGADTPDFVAAFAEVKALFVKGVALLELAKVALSQDDPARIAQGARLAKEGIEVVDRAWRMEMDFGVTLQHFYAAEGRAAKDVGDVAQAIVDADMVLMGLMTGGGLLVQGGSTFVRGVGLSMLVGPSASMAQAAYHGEDPMRAGAAAMPGAMVGGLAGGVMGQLAGGLAKPLTTIVDATVPELSSAVDGLIGLGASAVSGGLVSGGAAALEGQDAEGIRDAAAGGAIRGAFGKAGRIALDIK